MKRFLILLMLLCLCLPALAEDVKTSGNWEYIILEDNTAALTRCIEHGLVVEFPSEIDGYTVSQIGRSSKDYGIDPAQLVGSAHMDIVFNLFNYYEAIQPVVEGAVKKLVIPESVKVLGTGVVAMSGESLSLDLPDHIEEIHSLAFYGCNIAEVRLPAGLKRLEAQPLHQCGGDLEALSLVKVKKKDVIQLPEHLEYLGPKALGAMVSFPGSSNGKVSLTLPESLKTIDKYAFSGMYINELTLPESMETIPAYTFNNCRYLKTISFPQGLKHIGQGAFTGCEISLEKVELPKGLLTIGAEAFLGCKKLKAVTIPASVTEIGDYAFEDCAEKITFTVIKGSYGETWAKENDFKVKVKKK